MGASGLLKPESQQYQLQYAKQRCEHGLRVAHWIAGLMALLI